MTPAIPATIQVPADQVLLLRARAVGVQIYVCHLNPQAGQYEWVFEAPEAQLSDAGGKTHIHHFAGPSWQAADGSLVVGEVIAKDAGPDPLAIPWLLLHVKSSAGSGVLSRVQSIQRVHTVGGKAPSGGCNAELADSKARQSYSADYLFYGPRP
jgi:hypothetical protein